MENVKNGELNALLEDLVDFANSNEYQHPSYKAYADDFCNSFNRLVAELQTNEQKEVLEKIYNDFYLEIVTIVDHFNRRPDRDIKTLENRYRKLKQLILNGIALEPKKPTIYQPQQYKSKAEGETKTTLNLKDEIEGYFYYLQFDDCRKHKKILSDDDFERLVGWIEDYYKNGLEVPKIKNPIKEVNTAKGNVIETFRKFYKYKYPNSSYPESLWLLIKTIFFQYRNDTPSNISKAKKSTDYDILINKYKKNTTSVNS